MKRSTDHETRRGWSTPVRLLLGLGVLLGFGAVSTQAYWSDGATVDTGAFSAGALDIRIDGNLSGAGGTYTKTSATMTAMAPGESLAFVVAVQNPTSDPQSYLGFDYTATAWNTGTLASGLRWTVVPGGTVGNTGTQAAANRTGTCTGGTTTATSVTLGTTSGTATTVVATKRAVAPGASENVCIVVRLDPAASNALQGTTATATLTFTATQPGAP